MVTSEFEDEYSRLRSTEQLTREVRDHRVTIARTEQGTKFVDNLIADKEHLTKIIFRRKKPEEREEL